MEGNKMEQILANINLNNIFFIGGSPCGGKSTVAAMLAAETGYTNYKVDDFLALHMLCASREGMPHSKRALAFDNEQMWMRDPAIQRDEEILVYEEVLRFTLLDLEELAQNGPVIADGSGLMPELMAKLEVPRTNYICMVPTDSFQRDEYAQRTWVSRLLIGCHDPVKAFDNWMTRDALFADYVYAQAVKHGYQTLIVDGKRTVGEDFEIVKRCFCI